MTPFDALCVGVGGAAGSLLRWQVGLLIGARWTNARFPMGTFVINVSGAFAIGYLATLFGLDFRDRLGSILTAGVLTGFLGGYTTFSSMQLDAATLRTGAGSRAAAFYLTASVAAGCAAAALGVFLGQIGAAS